MLCGTACQSAKHTLHLPHAPSECKCTQRCLASQGTADALKAPRNKAVAPGSAHARRSTTKKQSTEGRHRCGSCPCAHSVCALGRRGVHFIGGCGSAAPCNDNCCVFSNRETTHGSESEASVQCSSCHEPWTDRWACFGMPADCHARPSDETSERSIRARSHDHGNHIRVLGFSAASAEPQLGMAAFNTHPACTRVQTNARFI